MIKKFTIIVVIIMMLFTSTAYANDGGSYAAGDELLEITIKPKTATAQIGQEFTVQVIMKNNDKYPIFFDNIYRMFHGQKIDIDAENISSLDNKIMPGTTVYFDLTFTVDETIRWYIKDGKYYADINPTIYYNAVVYDPPEDEIFEPTDGYGDYYWDFYYQGFEPIPIEISNISNGEHLISMELLEDTRDLYFYKKSVGPSNSYDGEYSSDITKTLIIKNIGDNDLENVYAPSYIYSYNNDSMFHINQGEQIVQRTKNHYFMKPEVIPDTLSAYYRAVFKVDDKYYGVIVEETMHTKFLPVPELKLEFSQIKEEGEYTSYVVNIENTSNKAYDNFIYYSERNVIASNIEQIYNEPKSFNPGDNIELTLYFETDNFFTRYFDIGFLIDDYVYTRNVYFEYEDNKIINFEVGTAESMSHISRYFEDICPIATVSPIGIPSSVITASPTDTPTPNITATAAPTPNADATIEKTQVRSNTPAWVYFALAAAVIAVGIMVYLNSRKAKSDTNTDIDK